MTNAQIKAECLAKLEGASYLDSLDIIELLALINDIKV